MPRSWQNKLLNYRQSLKNWMAHANWCLELLKIRVPEGLEHQHKKELAKYSSELFGCLECLRFVREVGKILKLEAENLHFVTYEMLKFDWEIVN